MRVRIVPYNLRSKSARLLAKALTEELGYRVWLGAPRYNQANIYWGNPGGANASKLDTFRILESAGVSIPDYTTDPEVAKSWLSSGTKILARKLLRASEGRGCVLVRPQDSASVPDAPLYVKYIPKKKEFRVHVLGGEIILVQEKRMKRGTGETINYQIRNHGDWVFCVNDIIEPEDLREVGHAAVMAVCPSTLCGAVDIVWNKKQDKCFVLEVNSAPGLCPKTAKIYAQFIKEKANASTAHNS